MNYGKLEKKLNELKEKFKADEEAWIKIPKFWNYEISTFGRIKSLETIEKRACPKTGKMMKYIRKESILKPLYIGPGRKWTAAKISLKQGEHRQFSLAKLLLSTFLNIPINKLPHSIYFIDCDSHNVKLHNLTFIYMNKENKKKK